MRLRNFADGQAERLLWLALLCGIWLFTTPYNGIWHDGNLYALQALHQIHPQYYAKELFFAFGSQDDFTLFTRIYALLIRLQGLEAATATLFIVCQIAWLGGAIRLFRRLLPEIPAYLCVLLLAVSRHHYGGFTVFAYSEGFLTARLPAEAFALWGLACATLPRFRIACALSLASILMHPLIGVWPLLLTLLQALRSRHSLILMLVIALGTGLVIAGVGPEILTRRFDAQWVALLHDGEVPYLFLDTWRHKNVQQTLFVVLANLAAVIFGPRSTRRFWGSVTLLGVTTLLLTQLACTWGHNVLATQLQPWRVLWVMQVLQWPAIATAVYGRRRAICFALLLMGLVMSYLANTANTEVAVGYALTFIVPVYPWLVRYQAFARLFRGMKQRQTGDVVLAVALTALFLFLLWDWITRLNIYLFDVSVVKGWVYFNILPAAVAILVMLACCIGPKARKLAMLACAVLAVELGLLFADERRPQELQAMQCTGQKLCNRAVRQLIPSGSLVYWEDRDGYSGAREAWFEAETAHYISGFLSSSRAFKRPLAIADEMRRRRINGLPRSPGAQTELFRYYDSHDIRRALTQRGVQRVCQDPGLDFIVAYGNYPDLAPVPLRTFAAQYLYRCGQLRNKTRHLAG